MTREKLEKFVPLGLLALVIVAGVVGVLTHTPPAKDGLGAEYDAGLDVIGYFSCVSSNPNSSFTKNFALVRNPNSFSVLEYRGLEKSLLAAGKPQDLSYFMKPDMFDVSETETYFSWKERLDIPDSYQSFELKRSNGSLGMISSIQGDIFPIGSACEFGKKARTAVWLGALNKWERIKPKF